VTIDSEKRGGQRISESIGKRAPAIVAGVILYDSPVSGNCYKVRLLAAHLGLQLERRPLDVVDRSNRPDVIGDLNPALRVPTLVLDDGRPLAESGAILWYLGAGTRFVPEDPYELAQALQWMFFEQYDFEPNIAVARFLIQYAGGAEQHADKLPALQKSGDAALAALEWHLGEDRHYLVGERLSIADIAVFGYTHVAEEGGFELGRYPAIRAWIARVATEPGHIPIDA
jgi:glutathione S-transferase